MNEVATMNKKAEGAVNRYNKALASAEVSMERSKGSL